MTSMPDSEGLQANIITKTLTAMSNLEAVLVDEINLLKKHDVEGIQSLLRRKNRLLLDYQSGLESIAANPEIISKAPAAMRAKLKAAGEKLAEIAENNARSLRGAVNATHFLIQFLINSVREEMLPVQGYKNPRDAGVKLGSYSPVCQPMAVKRMV